MRVEVFTLCWNEMAILPFAVQYWKLYANHVTVYDNGSDDGSAEYLASLPFVTLKHFETGNQKNNTVQMQLKNEMWKEARGRADLVVVCDMDEMLVPPPSSLIRMKEAGGTICKPLWYDLHSELAPVFNDVFLDTMRPYAVYNPGSKAVIFDPNEIDEINYNAGAHHCEPKGNVKWYGGDIYLLHVNNALSLEYRLNRYHQQAARRSEDDVKKGHAIHYTFPDDKIIEGWKEQRKKTVNFNAIVHWFTQPFI